MKSKDNDLTKLMFEVAAEAREKRIYVVVADTVTTLHQKIDGDVSSVDVKVVSQPFGRQSAQACHAVSLMRMKRVIESTVARRHKGGPGNYDHLLEPITTIILSARDSQELAHIHALLMHEEIPFETFMDTNDEAYGKGMSVQTVIATYPVEPVDVQGILDYLPLWGSSRHIKAG
jgi:hypothetical protein